ncbi:MAG: hypothetical protein PUJ72_05375, partial [Eubacteriales bacterium]|nr:hypothetical protein [Eubacteriales bacterium]
RMLFTKLAVRLGESGERFSSFCQSSISYFPAFVKRLLQFLSDFFARPVLFFEKKSRQKKLQLSGMIYRFLIICTDVACKKAKETSIIGEFVQIFQAPLCKGICKYAQHACRPRREGL